MIGFGCMAMLLLASKRLYSALVAGDVYMGVGGGGGG